MKIVISNPSLQCGGAERVIVQLANHWSKDHEVTIMTTDREEVPFFKLEEKVNRVAVLNGLSGSFLFSIPRKILSIWRIRTAIKKIKPDIVFAFQEKNALYILMSLIGLKIKKCVAVRNHPEFKKLSLPFSWLRFFFYKRVSKIVVQTKSIEQWYKTRGISNIVVIPNPVVDGELNEAVDSRKIFACGRLVPQKGFDLLIQAFAQIAPQFQEWSLQILGDGPQRKALQSLAQENQLGDRVIFKGFVDNPSQLYEKGAVFVLTSEYEGFPNSLCEAMASGLAVVSFDCPSGPSDLITEGENGLLVSNGDVKQLQEKLRKLLAEDQLREKLSSQAILVREKMALKKIADQWLDIIHE